MLTLNFLVSGFSTVGKLIGTRIVDSLGYSIRDYIKKDVLSLEKKIENTYRYINNSIDKIKDYLIENIIKYNIN